MKMASNSGCSRSPSRKTLNIASFTAVRCPQRYKMRFFPGATSTNSCSSEQLKHSVPTRLMTCSHDDIAVWMSTSSDAIETWLLIKIVASQRPTALLVVVMALVHYARAGPPSESAQAQCTRLAGHSDQIN